MLRCVSRIRTGRSKPAVRVYGASRPGEPPPGPPPGHGLLTVGLLHGTCIRGSGQESPPGPSEQKAAPTAMRSSDCRVSLSPAWGRGEAPCAVSASISFQLIRWALFSGPVHSLILRCRTWSSPHARSQLSPRYFQPRSACTQEAGERRRTETFKEPPEHKCGRQRLP